MSNMTTDLSGPNPPSWYTLPTGNLATSVPATTAYSGKPLFIQNLPSWAIVIFGSLALVVLAGGRFYKPIAVFLVGIILYRLMK
jgi:hypothetical protein